MDHAIKTTGRVLLLMSALFTAGLNCMARDSGAGMFDAWSDVGTCLIKGGTIYDPATQEYTLTGAGENMWFGKDAFHFLWKKMEGDFVLQFEFEFIGEAKNEHRKVGWMVRNELTEDSGHICGTVHNDGLTSIQYRPEPGSNTVEIVSPAKGPSIVQLERSGSRYILSTAKRGGEFVQIEFTDTREFVNDEAYVGIFLCSHEKDHAETAVMRNVRITIPAGDDVVPYEDHIGSHLEIMDVQTGKRRIVHSSPKSIQAPNWTLDGKWLIYNSEGLLYKFNIATAEIEPINTSFADNNNNDHVLSFDGEMLGISHHSAEDDNTSLIYTVPLSGGEPRKITAKGPSYLHGWSPDGRELLFTGERDGDYEIYSIDIDSKTETRLTRSPGLDDGSEFSPDGKYIYFNSVRSGTMQIWRMKPDGSEPERITDDTLNNWFPHVSPDGKWIVYLTYGNDVDPGDHPFCRHVSIRLMNLETRAVEVLAHLYGGQGTINVPSWSPDGKQIAFVSNTRMAN
jgi:Tol biopolymer transport system component